MCGDALPVAGGEGRLRPHQGPAGVSAGQNTLLVYSLFLSLLHRFGNQICIERRNLGVLADAAATEAHLGAWLVHRLHRAGTVAMQLSARRRLRVLIESKEYFPVLLMYISVFSGTFHHRQKL